ncbi:MAG: TolC family protein [Myxococcota bacterium]
MTLGITRLLVFGLLAFSFSALGKSLSLLEIFEIAKAQVESVSQQRVQVAFAHAQLLQIKSGFYPNVNFLFSYTRQQIPTVDNNGSVVAAFFNPDQYLTRFSATMSGLQGFREFAAYKAAKAAIRAQEANVNLVESGLYRQVSTAYYTYWGNRRDLDNILALKQSADERMGAIRKFVKIGRSRSADVLVQETQIGLLEAQAMAAKEAVRLSEESLRVMTGIEPQDDVAEDTAKLPEQLEPIESYLAKIDDRSEIRSLVAQVEAAENQTDVMRGSHFPTVGLAANYYPYRSGVLQHIHWDLGASINVPLFQGFGVVAQVRQAQATARGLRYGLMQARRDAERDIRTCYNTLQGVIQTLPILSRAQISARKSYEQLSNDYRYKLITNLEVNTAMTQLSTLMRSYDQTWYQGKTALENLHAAIGQVP